MSNTKKTTERVTKLAVEILKDNNSSTIAKKLAGSTLSQTNTNKQTSAELEDLASRVLTSNKYNDDTKTLAGSVLSQSNNLR